MIENISLDKPAVLAALQSQCVTPVGVHQDKLHILFLIEVAVFIHKLVIILIKVFAQMFRRLMCLSLIVVELLICLRHGDIEHGSFCLFRLQLQRVECSTILADFR